MYERNNFLSNNRRPSLRGNEKFIGQYLKRKFKILHKISLNRIFINLNKITLKKIFFKF